MIMPDTQMSRRQKDKYKTESNRLILLQKNLVLFLFYDASFYNILLLLVKHNIKTAMKTTNLSQTQSSQYQKQEQQPPLGLYQKFISEQTNPQMALQVIRQISERIKTAKGQQFELQLKTIIIVIQKGYAAEFLKFSGIMVAMMKQFCHLFRSIQSQPQAEGKMIFVLSTIAELIKEAGRFDFPFTQKFLKNLFLIDEELLEASPYKDSILAILGVLYQNLSRQGRLLNKLGICKEFKKMILTNYHLVSQGFSARFFNKSLYNLAMQGQSITEAQLHKYSVFETVSKFMPAGQVNALITKIRSALSRCHPQKTMKTPNENTDMIAQL